VEASWCERVQWAAGELRDTTLHLMGLCQQGDVEAMLRHSADFLELMSTVVVGWLWLWMAAAAREGLARRPEDAAFFEGKLCAAQYWIQGELGRVSHWAALCRSGEDSYARMKSEWF
jgi:hypothetical protein